MGDDADHNSSTDEEGHLFQQEMGGVKPLPQHQAKTNSRTDKIPEFTKGLRRRAAVTESTPPTDGLSDTHIDPIEPEQPIEYRITGLQHSRFKQLKQGQVPIDYNLDLHGCTIEEARNQLISFIAFCENKHISCARVIHGKSHRNFGQQNTMKSYVNQWLRQINTVQAFSSCLPRDGGRGAVYVLLKTRR